MTTLLAFLVHDRPEWLQKAFLGLRRPPGSPLRLVAYLDAPDEATRAVVAENADLVDDVLESDEASGPGVALNRVLSLRPGGEPFVRLDSDTEILTDDWLAKLSEGFGQGYRILAPAFRDHLGHLRVTAEHRWLQTPLTAAGLTLYHSSVLDRLGGFLTWPHYEDTDYFARAAKAGFRVAYDTMVETMTAPSEGVNRGRNDWVERYRRHDAERTEVHVPLG